MTGGRDLDARTRSLLTPGNVALAAAVAWFQVMGTMFAAHDEPGDAPLAPMAVA